MFVRLSQLLSGLKPILSLSASQLSCISAMAMGPQRNPANMPSSVPFGMRWRMIGPWPVIKHEPQQSPSVEELFGPGVDPEEEVLYPRYFDDLGEPRVICPSCGAEIFLSRIPFQNGCIKCKDMGLNILMHVSIFWCLSIVLYVCN